MIRRLFVLAAALTFAGCSSNSSNSSTATSMANGQTTAPAATRVPEVLPPTLTPVPTQATASTSATARSTTGDTAPRTPFPGFKEVTVKVRQPDGSVREYCLMLADSQELREQGLMHVTDRTLGGYPGMLFLFEQDQSGGFWMKNTVLPLSIAYVGNSGNIVTTTDMEPCPADEKTCPTYNASGSYRYAVEVPKGTLSNIGLTGQATLTVGDKSCRLA